MNTRNLTDIEKSELMKLSKIISQVNRRYMIELAEISKAIQESHYQEWVALIQQVRENQSAMLQEICEINWKSIKTSMDNFQQIEFTALKEAMKTSSCLYSDYLKNIQDTLKQSSIQEVLKTSKMLSLAYADTLSSFGAFIEFKPKFRIPKIQKLIQEEVKQNIDTRLEKLNSAYVSMRVGAWTTFNAKKPDYLRQSISSMRELLNHVLRTLSPNCKTRKERIRDILSRNGISSTEADFIESLAEYVDKLYALLSKVEHTLYKNDECVEMALKATEAAIVVILG